MQGLIVPSKLAGILGVGRPVIFVGDFQNSVAQALLRGQCGYVVPEGDAKHLKDLIIKIHSDPILGKNLGENGRRLFEQEYDRTVVVPRIISMLEKGF